MPKLATVTLKAISPYSASRSHEVPKLEKEGHDEYDKRTWRDKAHVDDADQVYIPAMAFKQAIDAASKYLSLKIPGKRNATYTKHFTAGCLVVDPVPLGIKKDALAMDRIYANADGIRGSGKRVWRQFPRVDSWKADVQFHLYDDEITKEVFEKVVTEAGRFIGIGRFRPEKGGFYGRFAVEKVKWSSL